MPEQTREFHFEERICKLEGCGKRFRVLSSSPQMYCSSGHAEQAGATRAKNKKKPWESWYTEHRKGPEWENEANGSSEMEKSNVSQSRKPVEEPKEPEGSEIREDNNTEHKEKKDDEGWEDLEIFDRSKKKRHPKKSGAKKKKTTKKKATPRKKVSRKKKSSKSRKQPAKKKEFSREHYARQKSAESKWAEYVNRAKTFVKKMNYHRMKVAELALEACEIKWGGSNVSGKTLRDFAREIGVHYKTLHRWVCLKRDVKDKLPEGMYREDDFMALQRTENKVRTNTNPEKVTEIYDRESSRSQHQYILAQLIKRVKTGRYFIVHKAEFDRLGTDELEELKILCNDIRMKIVEELKKR